LIHALSTALLEKAVRRGSKKLFRLSYRNAGLSEQMSARQCAVNASVLMATRFDRIVEPGRVGCMAALSALGWPHVRIIFISHVTALIWINARYE
jgi:hypothetical protein